MAMLILIVAALLLCHSRGRRFGAVRNLPGGDARPGSKYVESVGRLYKRAPMRPTWRLIFCAIPPPGVASQARTGFRCPP